MAARKLTVEDFKQIEKMAKGWGKIIVRQHWGEQGPGLDVSLTEMEDVAMAAVRALLAGTLEVATLQQASQLGEQQACPDCGKMCPLKQEERPIVVRTGTTFEHHEPKAHCPACRRDFFPSASGTETGHARLQPVSSEQDRASGRPGEVASTGRQGSRHRR
jgi:hypothetical protein